MNRIHAQTKGEYYFSSAIRENLLKDSSPWKEQTASWQLSFTGQYSQSLSLADSQYRSMKKPGTVSHEEANRIRQYKPVEALAYLLHRAEKEKIIIINEAHYQPMHRVFTTSLLKGLYEKGYRYLGLEALFGTDTMLQQRGYAVDSTGYYTQEPQFGNMIREALRLGFTVFGYESEEDNMSPKKREPAQARNIQAYMQQHPGKYIIHCGYDHAIEGKFPGWGKAMAGYLKEFTRIDPLTINQGALTEHSAPLYEKADYKLISAAFPAVLMNAHNEVYNGYQNDSLYDIRLFHPRTVFRQGRPGWLFCKGSLKKPFIIPSEKLTTSFPVLALAWKKGEDINAAVPFDIIEVSSKNNQVAMALAPGRYIIYLKSQDGQIVQWEQHIP